MNERLHNEVINTGTLIAVKKERPISMSVKMELFQTVGIIELVYRRETRALLERHKNIKSNRTGDKYMRNACGVT